MDRWYRDVLIFDNCPFFTRGLHAAFETSATTSITVVETFEREVACIHADDNALPRLLIIGPHIDTPHGFAACREATKHRINIIFMSAHVDDRIFIADAACMAVDRFLPISITAEELLIVASQILSDHHSIHPDIAFGEIHLSPRELEIVRLWSEGKVDKEVATSLHISHATARNHAARILTKLNVHSRLDAIHRARHHGLI